MEKYEILLPGRTSILVLNGEVRRVLRVWIKPAIGMGALSVRVVDMGLGAG